MTGIQFITDERGQKTAVVIDLKKHESPLGGLTRHSCLSLPPPRKAHSAGGCQSRFDQAWEAPCLATESR